MNQQEGRVRNSGENGLNKLEKFLVFLIVIAALTLTTLLILYKIGAFSGNTTAATEDVVDAGTDVDAFYEEGYPSEGIGSEDYEKIIRQGMQLKTLEEVQGLYNKSIAESANEEDKTYLMIGYAKELASRGDSVQAKEEINKINADNLKCPLSASYYNAVTEISRLAGDDEVVQQSNLAKEIEVRNQCDDERYEQ